VNSLSPFRSTGVLAGLAIVAVATVVAMAYVMVWGRRGRHGH
jgi:hypothetical protein